MDLQEVTALTVVAGALLYVGRSVWLRMKGRGGCACAHAKRTTPDNDGASKKSGGLSRLPLVTSDQVSRPYPSRSPSSSTKSERM